MQTKLLYMMLFFLVLTTMASGQVDELIVKKDSTVRTKRKITSFKEIDPLSPARAAFYSAVLPGLGQMYNKK